MPESSSSPGTRSAPPTNPHILHVADCDAFARFGLMLAQLLHGLTAHGLRISLLTDDLEATGRLAEIPVTSHYVEHLRGWRAWRVAPFLKTRLHPLPDAVHLWGTAGLFWIHRWATPRNIPVLIHVLGQHDVNRLLRRGLKPNESVATLSPALTQPLTDRFPLGAQRLAMLPPAVAHPIGPRPTREPHHTLTLLCVAHLEPHCGLDLLIDAVAQVRRDGFDVQAVAVGHGPGMPGTWQRIRDRDVQDCFSVVDEPHLWEKAVVEADILVVPACQRELWLVPLLAMGCDTLVIASRDQLGEWFQEERTAWQFTPGSPVELAYLISRAAEQPKLARPVQQQASEYVQAEHALGDRLVQMLAAYDALLPGHAVGPNIDLVSGNEHG